jgi:hypothetical protein
VGNQSFVLPDMAAAGTYTLLTTGNGVQLQSTTPGTQQTGNFNISGTGIAGILEAGTLDTATSGALSIGNTNATSISIGNATTNNTTTILGLGLVKTSGSDSTIAFQVQNHSGAATLDVDTANTRVGIGKTTPGYTLDVNGSAAAKQFVYNGTNGVYNSTQSSAAGALLDPLLLQNPNAIALHTVVGGSTQYWNGSAWTAWADTIAQSLLTTSSQHAGSTIDFTHQQFRFTVSGMAWSCTDAMNIVRDYTGNDATGTVTIETSPDDSTWTTQLSAINFGNKEQSWIGKGLCVGDAYWRITLDYPNLTSGQTFNLRQFEVFSTRGGVSGDAIETSGTDYSGAWLNTHLAVGYTAGQTNALAVNGNGNFTGMLQVGAATVHTGQLTIDNSVSSQRALILQAASGQSVDVMDIYDGSGNFVSGYDANGNLFLNGLVQTGTASSAGVLELKDGNADNASLSVTTTAIGTSRTLTLDGSGLTGNHTLTLPDANGTICLQSSASCGFLTGSASSYIQNQNSAQQPASKFWISGTGQADTSILTPTLDTATGTTLNIATSTATNVTVGSASETGTLTFGQSTSSNTINIGAAALGSSVTQTINIGTDAGGTTGTADNVTIGSNAASSGVTLNGGFGVNINGGLGINLTNNGLGGISLASGSAGVGINNGAGNASPVNIGSSSLGSGTQTIGIGNNSTLGGTTNITIGTSGSASGTTTLQASGALTLTGGASSTWSVGGSSGNLTIQTGGTGTLKLDSSGTVAVGNGNATTLNIGTGSTARTISIGNVTGATAVGIQCGTGACNFGSNTSDTGTISIGNASAGSLTIQSGGTINFGNGGVANTINIGNSTGAVTQTINLGANATAGSTNNVTVGSNVGGTTIIQASSSSETVSSTGFNIQANNQTNSNAFLVQGNGVATGAAVGTFFANTSSAVTALTAISLSGQASTTNTFSVQSKNGGTFTGMFSVGATGQVLSKPLTGHDSTTDFQVQPAGSATAVLDVDTSNGRVGVGTNAPTDNLEVVGNSSVYSSDGSKAYRFRTSGVALDMEGAGSDLYLSSWTGAGFTGTQQTFLRGYIGSATNSYLDEGLFVGTATASNTPMLLVLANKNSSDSTTPVPFEFEGGMYFNSAAHSFRCGQNGHWIACDGQVASASSASSSINNTNVKTNFDSASYSVPSGDCQPGVTYDMTMAGNYSNLHAWNFQWDLNEDGTGTTIANTTTSDPTASSTNNKGWYAHLTLTCYDTSGDAVIQGYVTMDNNNNGSTTWMISNGASTTSINGHTLYWGIKWNSSSTSNGAFMTQFQVVRHGPGSDS